MYFFVHVWLCCCHTAEKGLVASVRSRQRAQPLEPLVQNSAQMARMAKAPDGHAVQVHRLHKMAQQRPLQAKDVPSEGGYGDKDTEGGSDILKKCERRGEMRIFIIAPQAMKSTRQKNILETSVVLLTENSEDG